MSKIRTNLPTMLVLLALFSLLGGAVASGPASAQGTSYCIPVAMNGGFEDNNCMMAGGTRTWARAYPGPAARLYVCLKVPAGTGSYTDGNCGVAGGLKEWELFSTTAPVPAARGNIAGAVIGSIIAGVKIEVKCSQGTFEWQPELAGASSDGLMELKSCTVPKPANCTVTEPVKALFSSQLEEGAEKKVLDKLTGSKSEEGFIEISFKGESCALKGATEKIKGTQKCGFDTAIETLQTEHEVICKTSGSKLTLNKEPATFEGTATKVLSKVGATALAWNAFG